MLCVVRSRLALARCPLLAPERGPMSRGAHRAAGLRTVQHCNSEEHGVAAELTMLRCVAVTFRTAGAVRVREQRGIVSGVVA
jgi:hypothetical protein